MGSKLYIIATPLGNKNDITLRALEMFRELDCFFAEDSRELSKLMELHGIGLSGKAIHSYAKHNMREATEKALKILASGKSIGFVTDRGTPCISDPGYLLVHEARQEGHDIFPIPGPSSVVTALSVSGIPSDQFLFLGFLPLGEKEREGVWEKVRGAELPTCFFETAKRIRETLGEVAAEFPKGRVFLAREMTKLFETYSEADLGAFTSESLIEKGEYVVVFEPGESPGDGAGDLWREEIKLRLGTDKQWAKSVASRYGVPASEIYNALQKEKPRK